MECVDVHPCFTLLPKSHQMLAGRIRPEPRLGPWLSVPQGPPEPTALLFLKNTAGRDVGMEFGDVGCVRISFAINSKPFSTHSDWKPIESCLNQRKIHILALFWFYSGPILAQVTPDAGWPDPAGMELMAKGLRTQPTSRNSIPASQSLDFGIFPLYFLCFSRVLEPQTVFLQFYMKNV